MREFVGVKSILDLLFEIIRLIVESDTKSLSTTLLLKREALIFSRIAVPGFRTHLHNFNDYEQYLSNLAGELEWLMNQGVIFEPQESFDLRLLELDEYREASKAEDTLAKDAVEAMRPFFFNEEAKACPQVDLLANMTFQDVMTQAAPLLDFGQNLARRFSIQLRNLDDLDAYPLISKRLQPLQSAAVTKSEVVQIIVKALPIPDESTPWEQIIEYRSDPDSQSKFLALRHWMSEVARAELTPAEIEEKLEYLTDQYQQHMRLHRMKTNVGTLETVVTTGAEFLGDLVSFKWGKAAEALFSLRRRRVALLEGELTAPGSEVAYIVKARETFGHE